LERRETYFLRDLHYGHSDTVQVPEFSNNSGTLDIFNNWVDFSFEKLVGVRLLVVIYWRFLTDLASPLELVLRREEF